MRSRNSFTRNSFGGNRSSRNVRSMPQRVIKFATCAVFLTLGLILSLPFFYVVFILGTSFHHMTFWPTMIFLGFLFGGPIFFVGLLGIIDRSPNYTESSSVENDVARMRYVLETDRINRK